MLLLSQQSLAKVIEATVNTNFIDVRTGPGKGYPITYILEIGDTVSLLKQRARWVKVRDKQQRTGWLAASELVNLLNAQGMPLAEHTQSIDDYRNRRYEISLLTGDFGGAETIAVEWAFKFSQQMAASARFEQATGDVSNSQIGTVALSYLPYPSARISPFITIGAGNLSTDPNATIAQSERRSESTMLAAVGSYVYLRRNFVLKAEFDNYTVLTQRNNNEEINAWKIGFSIFF